MNLLQLSLATTSTNAEIPVQVSKVTVREGKRVFISATITDASHTCNMNFWSDSGAFAQLELNPNGGFFFMSGVFSNDPQYGLGCNSPILRTMTPQEKDVFIAGDAELLAFRDAEWQEILDTVTHDVVVEPIRTVLLALLTAPQIQLLFRRASAAVKNHHARRGGLTSHTLSMLRCGKALAPVYTDICPSLLYAGIITHDIGKIGENDTGEGFAAIPSVPGELLGHIAYGTLLVQTYWRRCGTESPELFKGKDFLLNHWLHLILSHHGTKEFGSPVTPRSPEAFLLHHIDTMDAHMEMIRATYSTVTPNQHGLVDAPYPLKTSLAIPVSRLLKNETSE